MGGKGMGRRSNGRRSCRQLNPIGKGGRRTLRSAGSPPGNLAPRRSRREGNGDGDCAAPFGSASSECVDATNSFQTANLRI
eukprot:8355181-Pyramimonas_sp.AAC.1